MATPSQELRRKLIERARAWAETVGAPWYESLSSTAPVVVFEPYVLDHSPRHGNFNDAAYFSILEDPHWAARLSKPHPRRNALPGDRGARARELDSCTSSDALLLNIMCHPRGRVAIAEALEVEGPPEFGVGGAIPILEGSTVVSDRSEIDLAFRGDRGSFSLIAEAKLTERDFTSKSRSVVERYAGLEAVFDVELLQHDGAEIADYQLIRNLLAAHYHKSRFVLLHDRRRPDLCERFDFVLRAVRPTGLVARSRAIAWQEIARHCPPDLQEFLAQKYGIDG